jgi:CBS domain containing-hemolysin-like protein
MADGVAIAVAVMVTVYAVLSATSLATVWALRRGELADTLGAELTPHVRALLETYAAGPALGAWIVSVGLASAAVAFVWMRADAALWAFAAAIAIDLALFFSWPGRTGYTAALNSAERLGEAMLCTLMLIALAGLLWLSRAGALQS